MVKRTRVDNGVGAGDRRVALCPVSNSKLHSTMFRQTLRTVTKVNRLAGVRSYAEAANALKLNFAMPHDVCILIID